jgi:hypothetical protein
MVRVMSQRVMRNEDQSLVTRCYPPRRSISLWGQIGSWSKIN